MKGRRDRDKRGSWGKTVEDYVEETNKIPKKMMLKNRLNSAHYFRHEQQQNYQLLQGELHRGEKECLYSPALKVFICSHNTEVATETVTEVNKNKEKGWNERSSWTRFNQITD